MVPQQVSFVERSSLSQRVPYRRFHCTVVTTPTDPGSCSLEGFHVNAVAAAVGAFFRELPTPLIPKDRYTDILRTIGTILSMQTPSKGIEF